ncbi:unnamed protein product [Didymodactylos carnosus]|uniref:Transmembrane protein 231 n=1 Tax=Didymodactylos carnosus TaxID=1234261 RepID=A0A813TTS7_9BILA|nr:unnamed protein product [Didymodactylos carnosus]CAF0817228.1 unnamed protein product [Didymodactylos carnosus]CAF3517296.1 unnamed protein product [Didymodactylos carnosus]CAF3603451.1 unnamed protein product [Didymodactylos carnosus]
METLGLISLVPPIGLTTKIVTIYGQLQFEQNQPIKSHGSDSTLDTSIFPDNIQPLDNILSNYFSRTYYTLFKQQYIQWTSSIQEPSTLQVTVVLNVGRQTVRYVPSFWEEFKWGLIQYTAVLIPLLFLINKAKEFLFANQLVRTIVHTSNNKRHKA